MTNKGLSLGKLRRLHTAASASGVFRILAIDHRAVLLRILDRNGHGDVPAHRVTQFKLEVARTLGPLATAVILDPQYSIQQAIASGALPGDVGLLASLPGKPSGEHCRAAEAEDFEGVLKARQIGASGVKLFLSYHCDGSDRTTSQESLVRETIAQCHEEAMPLFLEPVLRSIDLGASTESAQFAGRRRQLATSTAARLGAMGPDVLKLEFPVDGRHERDEAVWRAACAELNDASPVPWALLSGGGSFDVFKTQLQIACEAGCSGFMAGRSLWNEAATAEAGERSKILRDLILPRLEELNQIADRYGQSWQKKCAALGGTAG